MIKVLLATVCAFSISTFAAPDGVRAVVTGPGLVGGPITSTGTVSVDVGTAAGQIVQLNERAQLPAVDGSQLSNVRVPSGTWCGNSSSGRRCMGHQPATSCPKGYGQDYILNANGEVIMYMCIKY